MKTAFATIIMLISQIVCAQVYTHTTERAEALSDPDFFSMFYVPAKGIYTILLYVPEDQQQVQDTVVNEIMVPEIKTIEVERMVDPIYPEIDTNLFMGAVETDMSMPMSESKTLAIEKEPEIKIKPKPAPVLMVENVKVLQIKRGTLNTLSLTDTTYWLVIDGNHKKSITLKPIVRKEWECCYLIYEWMVELDAEQYIQIWHNDKIRDFELGDYYEARDQYFSQVPEGEKIPDYYHGLILKVNALKK